MVKRIPFSVLFASGEDLDYPASELNTHGPTVQGWRSPRESLSSPPPPTSNGGAAVTAPSDSATSPVDTVATTAPCMQEIVLRFQQAANISRIQVLTHQFMIPERIELWIHYAAADDAADASHVASTPPPNQLYEYMGFITLADNASTAFKSRELQSVNVGPRRGTHLKLRLGPAHANPHNTFHQVALIAVNVLGNELPAQSPCAANTNESDVPAAAAASMDNGQTMMTTTAAALQSICDDLSFSMYVDESVADVVRLMETKKAAAVNDERFEYARKLKLCMTALRGAGERIGRYALAKRQAVQLEDFITAKLRKEQIELYRRLVFEHLLVDMLLEFGGPNTGNDCVCKVYAQKPVLPSAPSLQDVAGSMLGATNTASCSGSASGSSTAPSANTPATQPNTASTASTTTSGGGGGVADLMSVSSASMTPSSPMLGGRTSKRGSPTRSRGNSLHRRNKSAPRNSFEDYEERAVPALKHSHTNEFLRECQGAAILENDPCRGRSRLNERERRQAALPILVFGNEMVELFYSRQFQDREEGLLQLGAILSGHESTADDGTVDSVAVAALEAQRIAVGINKIARSSTLLLHRTVRDAVYSVFSLATETVRALFVDFVPARVTASEVARCVDRLLPELLSKCGDPSPRIHTLAQHTILTIAACPEVREQHLVAPALSRTVGTGTHPRLALSRMQMLEQLVLNQGISADKQSGMTCRTLSECGCSGIHHPSEPVRKVAERILVLVYNVNPRLVRKQLPPDDDITRRNLLYRQLFTEFDKLDVQRRKEMLVVQQPQQHLQQHQQQQHQKPDKPETLLFAIGNATITQRASSPTTQTAVRCSADLKTMTIDRNRHQRSKFGFNPSDRSMYAPRSPAATATSSSTPSKPTPTSGNPHGSDSAAGCVSRMPVSQRGSIGSNGSNGSGRRVGTPVTKISPPPDEPPNGASSSADGKPFLGQCPFCKWMYSGDGHELDKHFWKACPLLHKCPQCSQVQEVSALHEHLLGECAGKAEYVRCDRCTEVVHKDVFDIHAMEAYCRPVAATACGRCPLCHEDVPEASGWREHLSQAGRCAGNARCLQ